jgi:hypothetical protein
MVQPNQITPALLDAAVAACNRVLQVSVDHNIIVDSCLKTGVQQAIEDHLKRPFDPVTDQDLLVALCPKIRVRFDVEIDPTCANAS